MNARWPLQMYWFDEEPEIHVSELLDRWVLPLGASVLDCGCGTGAMPQLVAIERPDVSWFLLNTDRQQLGECHADLPRIAGDMHALPFADASMDDVLLSYVLGYGHPNVVFREISRVLRVGGTCCQLDMRCADLGKADRVVLNLRYRPHPMWFLLETAQRHGLTLRHEECLEKTVLHPGVLPIKDVIEDILVGAEPVCLIWEKIAA